MGRSILAPHDSRDSESNDAGPVFDIIETDLSVLADCMASLLSFTQVTTKVVAREHGARVLDSRFDISAELGALHPGEQGEPRVAGLRLRAEITTDASADQLSRLRVETERRCPMIALLRRNGIPVTSQWTWRAPD
jgi:OsmC-like protein